MFQNLREISVHARRRNVLVLQNLGFSLKKEKLPDNFVLTILLSAVNKHGNSTERKSLLSKLRNVAPTMVELVTNSYRLWVQSSGYVGPSVS